MAWCTDGSIKHREPRTDNVFYNLLLLHLCIHLCLKSDWDMCFCKHDFTLTVLYVFYWYRCILLFLFLYVHFGFGVCVCVWAWVGVYAYVGAILHLPIMHATSGAHRGIYSVNHICGSGVYTFNSKKFCFTMFWSILHGCKWMCS